MKVTILQGSPRREGNTAFLTRAFQEECVRLGVETDYFHLYDLDVNPCLGCMACQDVLDGLGCVQHDAFARVFTAMADSDVILLATPIYAWYCTTPMKALVDRMRRCDPFTNHAGPTPTQPGFTGTGPCHGNPKFVISD